MQLLMDTARLRGFINMTGEVITENTNMLQLVRELGFSISRKQDDPAVCEISRLLQ